MFLTPSHAFENTVPKKLVVLLKMFFTESQSPEKNEPQLEKTPLIASHAPEKSPRSTDLTAEKIPAIVSNTVWKYEAATPHTSFTFSHAVLKYAAITLSPPKNAQIGSSTPDSNHPAAVLQMLLTPSHAFEKAAPINSPIFAKMFTAASNSPEKNEPQLAKMPLTASHAPEKSPWSTDLTAEKIPAIVSHNVVKNETATPHTCFTLSHAVLK